MKTIRHATANVLGYTAGAILGVSVLLCWALAWVAMQIDGGQDKGEAA